MCLLYLSDVFESFEKCLRFIKKKKIPPIQNKWDARIGSILPCRFSHGFPTRNPTLFSKKYGFPTLFDRIGWGQNL